MIHYEIFNPVTGVNFSEKFASFEQADARKDQLMLAHYQEQQARTQTLIDDLNQVGLSIRPIDPNTVDTSIWENFYFFWNNLYQVYKITTNQDGGMNIETLTDCTLPPDIQINVAQTNL